MRALNGFLALGAVATLTALAATAKTATRVAVVLTTAGGSGPIGTAILEQRPSGVLVTVKFAIRQPVRGKAAIYKGDCTSPGAGRPAYTLRPVEHGLSQTTLHGVSIRTLTSGGYALVMQYRPTSLCGDLREAQPLPRSGS